MKTTRSQEQPSNTKQTMKENNHTKICIRIHVGRVKGGRQLREIELEERQAHRLTNNQQQQCRIAS